MMKSRELKTKIYSHAHSLILSLGDPIDSLHSLRLDASGFKRHWDDTDENCLVSDFEVAVYTHTLTHSHCHLYLLLSCRNIVKERKRRGRAYVCACETDRK